MSAPVGIVLVSHSGRLVEGLADLLGQLAPASVPLATAGGTEEGGLGTSYDLVAAAVRAADRGAGVAVIPDLGSAVLTARTVLEDLDRPDVVLVDAPFVEGAVAAAVAAAAGVDLAAVVAAAREARRIDKF
ncbi:dihydroxyacetone kinase phosphoryl donor subunit DhaM [Marinitenerispora sediminis]|uniref:phosphoenolpyruvate--glycerone phosphotransferase n=1 Tax=Marinitenerispora sediminis TaxID=1931232 RepID=A0A368T2Y2_9ACTN|nr:dihydroxyacetone kinase phosphoryl donor subunit DhaM [Marinitenerispora sediminis]RCV48083.1 phosphoenolpyruvate--protein phosphotransferase [Marinitenerispora sediminis]RCV51887.1 phosphoenolpyruvate--protein phosphotransferase [Marinitenerispora sediminis]RCV55660.1 phosphoenolpyruvate--protein phosphotransferase [Marinitenerispora sediminis]